MPSHTPPNTAAANTHPDTANAEIPDSSVPTVQPSANIDPHPIAIPPSSAVDVPRSVNGEISIRLAVSAEANEPNTSPPINQPFSVMACTTTAAQPANPSSPFRRPASNPA